MEANKIKKAGAVILSSDFGSIALVNHPQKNDWSFPKGHVELGENFQQTMLREIKEETGMDVTIIKQLPAMEYKNNNGDDVAVEMFLSVFQPSDKKIDEGEEKVGWIPVNEVRDKLSYKNLKDYFSIILPDIVAMRSKLKKIAIVV